MKTMYRVLYQPEGSSQGYIGDFETLEEARKSVDETSPGVAPSGTTFEYEWESYRKANWSQCVPPDEFGFDPDDIALEWIGDCAIYEVGELA